MELKKIDTATIFFFLGILLAVSSLQSAGQLDIVAKWLDATFNGQTKNGIYIINIIIGLLSSIVDNVPLVAGAWECIQLQKQDFVKRRIILGVFGILCRNWRICSNYWVCSGSSSYGNIKS